MPDATLSKRRRLVYFIGIPILIIAILIAIAVLGVNTFLKPTIKNTLSKMVVDGSDSLYRLSLDDYTISMGGSAVDIKNLSIQIDSGRYQKMKKSNSLPPLIFSIRLPQANIRGLNPWALWRNKNVKVNSVVLDSAEIHLQQQKNESDSISDNQPRTFYEAIKPDINTIDVGYIEIKNSNLIFRTLEQETNQKERWQFEKMVIKVSDILVDANSHKDTNRILYAQNIHAGFDSLSMTSTDGLYKFSVGTTAYDFKDRLVSVEQFVLQPNVSQQEFNRRKGHMADRFTAHVKKIRINNFNAAALLVQNRLSTGTILLDKPNLSIYKDKTAGPNNTDKTGKYPHQLLLKSTMPISIDSIRIKDGDFTYTEKGLKTLMDGSFKFNNVHGVVPNITNLPAEIERNKWCKADLSAMFMGKNDMRAIFSFDLGSNDGHFMVDANLESLNANHLNPVFRSLAKAELESFVLDKLAYHVEGNDKLAAGNLTLLYHDLKLNVLKTDADGNFAKKGLISALANMLKLHSNNPETGELQRKAINIQERRIPTKNFFGLVIKTLLTCTQEIVVKGKNKSLPGLGGNASASNEVSDKKDSKSNEKPSEKKKDNKAKRKN